MALALVNGLSSGALHAVTGPDHILSLTPLAAGRRRGAWRIGLLWGLGHGLGTVVVAVLMVVLAARVDLGALSGMSERIAGAALLGMGAFGLWSMRRQARAHTNERADEDADEAKAASTSADTGTAASVALVGLVHGLTGATGLLLVLPAMLSGSHALRMLFLAGFSVGGAAAMACLTLVIARALDGRKLSKAASVVRRVACTLSMVLGAAWMAL